MSLGRLSPNQERNRRSVRPYALLLVVCAISGVGECWAHVPIGEGNVRKFTSYPADSTLRASIMLTPPNPSPGETCEVIVSIRHIDEGTRAEVEPLSIVISRRDIPDSTWTYEIRHFEADTTGVFFEIPITYPAPGPYRDVVLFEDMEFNEYRLTADYEVSQRAGPNFVLLGVMGAVLIGLLVAVLSARKRRLAKGDE